MGHAPSWQHPISTNATIRGDTMVYARGEAQGERWRPVPAQRSAEKRSAGMPTKITMPQLGESVAEGTVGRWLKNVGDMVKRDESLVEIITDKVTAELPSPVSGRLTQIYVKEDETVKVGTEIAEIDDGSGASTTAGGPGVASTTSAPTPSTA